MGKFTKLTKANRILTAFLGAVYYSSVFAINGDSLE